MVRTCLIELILTRAAEGHQVIVLYCLRNENERMNFMRRDFLTKGLSRGIPFVLILTIILSVFRSYLGQVDADFVGNMYALERNSADVMFFGSSNVFANVNPAVLYENTGITAYTLAGSSQPIWNVYYYLREAYKTQHPKLVVIDMRSLSYDTDYFSIADAYRYIWRLRPSMNKWDAIVCSSENANVSLNMLLGWPIFHTRWREGKTLFDNKYNAEKFGAMRMGFYPVYGWNFALGLDYKPNTSTNIFTLREKNDTYLRKTIELAQAEGSEVLLLKTPYVQDEYLDGVYNYAEQVAAEYHVNSLNMNKVDFEFSYALCFADNEHLNEYGVERATEYLGEYLRNNYDLPDRRGEGENAWDQYLELYKSTLFQCPAIIDKELLIHNPLQIEHGSTLGMVEYPIPLEVGTYYKIIIDMNADCYNFYNVDFCSPGYDNAEQERIIPIFPGESTATVFIYSGENPIPDGTTFRILLREDYNLNFEIKSLTVEKLTVKEE